MGDPWTDSYAFDRSFSERMQDAQDAAAYALHRASGRMPGRIIRKRESMKRRVVSPAELSRILGVSRQRVSELLAAGRIGGAHRSKGRWRIRENAEGQFDISIGTRGPALGQRPGESDAVSI